MKNNIVRSLLKFDTTVTVVPHDFPFMNGEIEFDGLFISANLTLTDGESTLETDNGNVTFPFRKLSETSKTMVEREEGSQKPLVEIYSTIWKGKTCERYDSSLLYFKHS